MAVPSKYQLVKKQLDEDKRDIADLWNTAIKAYNDAAERKLTPDFGSVQQMREFADQQTIEFNIFRDHRPQWDKIRHLLKDNLDYIEKGVEQLAAAATPAFPPAAAIGTAFTYIFKLCLGSACKDQSATYDAVSNFLEDMNAFLRRISILEQKLPSFAEYRNCIGDVFSAMLVLCGHVTKKIDRGRFKEFVASLLRGQDPKIADARKNMNVTISRLQDATEYAILGNTQLGLELSIELSENQRRHETMLEAQMLTLETVKENTETMKADTAQIRSDVQRMLLVMEQSRKEPSNKSNARVSGQNKPPSANQVRAYFADHTRFEEMVHPIVEYQKIADTLIPGTNEWIFEEAAWLDWCKQETGSERILWITGPPGTGKSHIAASIYTRLRTSSDAETCVVHFWFRETIVAFNSFENVLNWLVIEAAEQNDMLCERISALISRDDINIDYDSWEDILKKVLRPLFSGPTNPRLQIVLDGVDELDTWRGGGVRAKGMEAFFKAVNTTSDMNISFVCTKRSYWRETSKPGAIVLTKENQLPDMKALIWNHLNTDEGLRSLSRHGKESIAKTLEEDVDVLSSADLILRQFNVLRRESAILQRLKLVPKNLNELYASMEQTLLSHASAEQETSMKGLLMWLAWSYRELSLDECISLCKHVLGGVLDIEDELEGGRLARVLRVANPGERTESNLDQSATATFVADHADASAVFHDGAMPVQFYDRSMRSYFGGAGTQDSGLRTWISEANRRMFITCSNILTGKAGEVVNGLRHYAARYWLKHLMNTDIDEHTLPDQVSVLEALVGIANNENNVAIQFETLGVNYDMMELGKTEEQQDALDQMAKCAWLGSPASRKAYGDIQRSPAAKAWWATVDEDERSALLQLLHGHIKNWAEANSEKVALRSYKFARRILPMTNLNHLVPTPKKQSEYKQMFGDDDEEEDYYITKEVVGVAKHFLDGNPKFRPYAQWAVAVVLSKSRHHQEALARALTAQQDAVNPIERFRAMDLIAQLWLMLRRDPKFDSAKAGGDEKDSIAKAYDVINEALSLNEIPAKLRQDGLITRGTIESCLNDRDAAVASFAEARLSLPDEQANGHALAREVGVYSSKADDVKLLAVVKGWTVMERLAWMTWDYNQNRWNHADFQQAAALTGETHFIVEAYNEVVQRLDLMSAAAPIRYELALTHWYVRGDLEATKTVLDELLDTTTSREMYRIMNEEPAFLIIQAVNFMSDVLYEQFRSTPNREIKQKLFDEAKALLQRKLVLAVPPTKSEVAHHAIVVARMAKKMGPLVEFESGLEGAFQSCYEVLTDDIAWNDSQSLSSLTKILASFDCLATEAQIALSAQFSQLEATKKPVAQSDAQLEKVDDVSGGNKSLQPEDEDSGEDDNEDEDEDSDEGADKEDDDDESQFDAYDSLDDSDDQIDGSDPTDEGDLSYNDIDCSGECAKNFGSWKGRNLYQCIICNNCFLCEECYQKRLAYNTGAKRTPGLLYCGINHKYVKGPIEGWKGIENGVMMIEGRVPITFREWLDDLKQTKMKTAWEQFWLLDE